MLIGSFLSIAPLIEAKTHTVKQGDTIYDLSRKYHVSEDEIIKANKLSGSKLSLDQKLVIPNSTQNKEDNSIKKDTKKEDKKQSKKKDKEITSQTTKEGNTSSENRKKEKDKDGKAKAPVSKELQKEQNISIDNPDKTKKKKEIKTISAPPKQIELKTDTPPSKDAKTHIVKQGETLYSIAKLYNVEVVDLMEYNKLSTFRLKIGQKIFLKSGTITNTQDETRVQNPAVNPPSDNASNYHIVQKGENLYRISKLYNIPIDDLVKLNNLGDIRVKEGQKIFLKKQTSVVNMDDEESTLNIDHTQPFLSLHNNLVQPVRNARIISNFGMRNGRMHKGVDIAAPSGEPIYAALPGKVVFVGWQRGYGNVVILEHDNFVMTLYAHNETNMVTLGDYVTQGQQIATVGATGNAQGSHCHFEYRVRSVAINPRKVLTGY